MKNIGTLAAALAAVAMLSTTPAMAKDIVIKTPEIPQAPMVSAPKAPKADLSESTGSGTKDVVDSTQKKIEKAAEKLKDQFSGTKQGREAADVTRESVTVETPSGMARETETVITPQTTAK